MKILLVDDHVLFREGLVYVLDAFSEDNYILEASDAEGAYTVLKNHHDIDLALVDLNLPGDDGFAVVKFMQKHCRTIPVVVLSASKKAFDMQHAIDLGAMGFIPKDSSSELMKNALNAVFAGEIYLPAQMLKTQLDLDQLYEQGKNLPLTPRQTEVLSMIVNGSSNKVIAYKMDVAEATIKMHVTAIFKKLNVSNRTQAALAAKSFLVED